MNNLKLQTKQKLLQLARQAITEHLGLSQVNIAINDPVVNEKRGVFVTLKYKGQLRGCIGLIEGIKPLKEAVVEMAQAAAFEDSRFPVLSVKELKELSIEISVLTPLRKITDPQQIKLGKDGVVISRDYQRGVFLPQVATETGWNLEEYLNHLCVEKAGLEYEAWKNKDTEMFIFQSESFSEN